jgi:hypothetical protein
MKQNGLTTMDDFKDTWEKKRQEREAFYSGKPYDSESRKRDLIESIRKLGGDI